MGHENDDRLTLKPKFRVKAVLEGNCCGKSRTPESAWAWLVCFCGGTANVIVLGCSGSFGVLFPALLDEFKAGKGKTAWIGSLGMAFTFFCGPVTGKMCERLGCRAVAIFGTLILITGLISSSQASTITVLFLTYSILSAFGISCIYTSVFIIVPKYFTKRRSLATGLIASGPGAGVFILVPIVQACLDVVGWRGAFLIMAGVVSPICVLACSFDPNLDNPLPSEELKSKQADFTVGTKLSCVWWKNPDWIICTLSTAILSFGNPIPQVHMVRYCEELGILPDDASKLYVSFGVSSLLSRVLTGRLMDVVQSTQSIPPHYIYQISVTVIGLSTALCPLSSSYTWLMAYFTIYGLAEGTFATSINVLILTSVEEEQRGKAYGFWLMAFSVPMALGPPVAGFMADSLNSYAPSFYMAGSVVIFSAVIVFLLPYFHRQKFRSQTQLLETTV